MERRDCDIAIVGGGLAGGLIALALARHCPDLGLRLIEQGSAPGGNHRWSWFASDLDAAGTALMDSFAPMRWDDGYEVAFPGYRRHLRTAYRSLASRDFAAVLLRELPAGSVLTGRAAHVLDASGVTLDDGERIAARCVFDCRGFVPSDRLQGGWQVFLGRHLRLERPHEVARPVIMDARVAQLGGYRFVYVLPLGPRDLFIEDTYYRDTPVLERAALGERLDAYARERGWRGAILAEESGVLPVVTGGDFAAFQAGQRTEGVGLAGARGGFTHPLTSYTLPFAAATALAIAKAAGASRGALDGKALATMLEARARAHWRTTGFYRRLGSMLLGAAADEERIRVFEHFYRLSPDLVERFYAARSTMADRARIVCGRPPVPVGRALRALTSSRPPLADRSAASAQGFAERPDPTRRSAA